MRIIIIDDLENVRVTLRKHIQTHYSKATVIGEADNITSGFEIIKNEKPDVVLLDIKMPGGSGFDLLKKLMPISFKLIFITGHTEFALQAFKFNALDYLLKPIDPTELVNALDRAFSQLQSNELNMKLNNFIHNMTGITRESKKIILKAKDQLRVISVSEIIRCEADGNYTRFFFKDGKSLLASQTLKEYDEMLVDFGFFRSHNSHLINISHISAFAKQNDGGNLTMIDNSKVPVAVRKKDVLIELLENI